MQPSGATPPHGAGIGSSERRRRDRLHDAVENLTGAIVDDVAVGTLLSRVAEYGAEVLEFAAAGITVSVGPPPAGRSPVLTAAAASSGEGHRLEAFAATAGDGPGIDCLRGVRTVTCGDLVAEGRRRWPWFAPRATEAGFRAAHSVPMRSGREAVGALTLLHRSPFVLDQEGARLGQTLADLGAIVVARDRLERRARTAEEDLTGAVGSRAIVEQGQGIVTAVLGLRPDEALELLRRHAETRHQQLVDLAQRIISGVVHPADLDG